MLVKHLWPGPGENLEKNKKKHCKIFRLLFLLQISNIFIASTKALNVRQLSTENQTFAISFTFL